MGSVLSGISGGAAALHLLAGAWVGYAIVDIRCRRRRVTSKAKSSRPAIATNHEAQWLDGTIETLWPRIAPYVERTLRNALEPLIQEQLQRLQTRMGIKDVSEFSFREMHFGDIISDSGLLTVSRSDVSRPEDIKMTLGMSLRTDTCLDINILGIHLGIGKLNIAGSLAIVFTPPKDAPPFFGGLKIFFPDMPEVDFSFVGVLSLADLPIVKNVIKKHVKEAIAGAVVLPHMRAVDLDEEDDFDSIDLQCPEPLYVLRVTLKRGKDLAAMDWNWGRPSTSDPYVMLSLGCEEHTTSVVEKTLNPQWNNATYDFLVHSDDQHITFNVYDEDQLTYHDLIGVSPSIGTKELLEGNGNNGEYRVPLTRDGESTGTLFVSGQYVRLAKEKPRTSQMASGPSAAFLAVKVVEITGLSVPTPSSGSKGAPYKVRLKVAGKEVTTYGSYDKGAPQMAWELQDLCVKLHKNGHFQPEEIAKLLKCDVEQVQAIIAQSASGDSEQIKKVVQETVDRRAATNPYFGQIQQLLLPEHYLRVTIVGCTGLRNADWLPGSGVSDPYCVCKVAGKLKSLQSEFRTPVVNDDLNPTWNHTATLHDYGPGDCLSFKVYDKDFDKVSTELLSSVLDDFLGETTLKIETVLQEDGFDGELALASAGRGYHPHLHVKVEVVRPVMGAAQDPASDDCNVELQLLDNATSVIASAKVPISDIVSAKELVVARQIRLDPVRELISDEAIMLHGSFAMRWLASGSPNRTRRLTSCCERERAPGLQSCLAPWCWDSQQEGANEL